ncbi:MAG: hypothetical protein LBH28_09785 [Oscillospiraceae bacterium]|nr:hypothetical protein [Oscillospiraceae bacterium]
MPNIRNFAKDTRGDAVVEAAILFPIIIMIFAALVLLAMYLPTRAALQRATQYAATAISVEKSDTWLFFDEDAMDYYWTDDKSSLKNVYVALFSGIDGDGAKAENIVRGIEERSVSSKAGNLAVDCQIVNYLVYKEVVVTATREFTLPVNLSIIRFPKTIPVSVTSTAVVQNGDEFIRSIDLCVDFVNFISEKFGLTNISESIGSFGEKVSSILGWK